MNLKDMDINPKECVICLGSFLGRARQITYNEAHRTPQDPNQDGWIVFNLHGGKHWVSKEDFEKNYRVITDNEIKNL